MQFLRMLVPLTTPPSCPCVVIANRQTQGTEEVRLGDENSDPKADCLFALTYLTSLYFTLWKKKLLIWYKHGSKWSNDCFPYMGIIVHTWQACVVKPVFYCWTCTPLIHNLSINFRPHLQISSSLLNTGPIEYWYSLIPLYVPSNYCHAFLCREHAICHL